MGLVRKYLTLWASTLEAAILKFRWSDFIYRMLSCMFWRILGVSIPIIRILSCMVYICAIFILLPASCLFMRDVFAFWDIQDRCNILREKYQDKHDKSLKGSGESWSERSILLDKSLGAALDSFDNLFCRRCLVLHISGLIFLLAFLCSISSLDCVCFHANMLASIQQVFDCRLHGCSQSPINPVSSNPVFSLSPSSFPLRQCEVYFSGWWSNRLCLTDWKTVEQFRVWRGWETLQWPVLPSGKDFVLVVLEMLNFMSFELHCPVGIN